MRHLVFLALLGCARVGDPADDPVESATLVNLDTNAMMVVGGPLFGDAILVYTMPGGGSRSLPVAVNGGALGLVLAMSADLNMNSDVALDLSDADDDLRVRDLLGTYVGTGWNLTMALGGSGNRLRNGHGVRLSDEHFTVGIGIEAGLEWLRVREGGNEDGLDDDWNPDSGLDSGDTGRGETGPVDTAPPVDTGGPPSGCDGGNSGSSGSSGCDGGCDGVDACGCMSGGMLPAPFGFVAVLTLLRRRRGVKSDG